MTFDSYNKKYSNFNKKNNNYLHKIDGYIYSYSNENVFVYDKKKEKCEKKKLSDIDIDNLDLYRCSICYKTFMNTKDLIIHCKDSNDSIHSDNSKNRDVTKPVLFFHCEDSFENHFPFPQPVKGKYILVRVICKQTGTSGNNVDISHIIIKGKRKGDEIDAIKKFNMFYIQEVFIILFRIQVKNFL